MDQNKTKNSEEIYKEDKCRRKSDNTPTFLDLIF